jgi:hypothetical protein
LARIRVAISPLPTKISGVPDVGCDKVKVSQAYSSGGVYLSQVGLSR